MTKQENEFTGTIKTKVSDEQSPKDIKDLFIRDIKVGDVSSV